MTDNAIAPTDVPEVTREKIDDLEHKIEDAEAAYERNHPKPEPMHPLVGGDLDESQHPDAKDA